AFSARAERLDRGPIRLTSFTLEDADVAAEGSGTVEPGALWADWHGFPFTASLRGRTKTPRERELEGGVQARIEDLALTGEARGTLGRPTGSVEVQARGLRLADERIQRLRAQAAVDWPTLTLTRLEAASEDGTLV